MTSTTKIVITVVNMGCLLVTLAFPNDMTPFAVMIAIVPLCAWAFGTYNDGSRHSRGLLAYILVVSIIAVSCLLIGVCTNVVMVDSGNEIVSELGDTFSHYEIRVKPGTFVLSGKRYDYTFVALVEFLVVLMLSWIDIHATRAEKPIYGVKNNNVNHSCSIMTMIDDEIGHIR